MTGRSAALCADCTVLMPARTAIVGRRGVYLTRREWAWKRREHRGCFGTPPDAAAALAFQLSAVPDSFIIPLPWYGGAARHSPVHPLAPDSVLLTRYDDVLAMYREPAASSDKRREFGPKFGDSPLFEHHTSSLVFNDPPLHTRVRRLLVGALNQQAIARMEAGVVTLVDGLLDRLARGGQRST